MQQLVHQWLSSCVHPTTFHRDHGHIIIFSMMTLTAIIMVIAIRVHSSTVIITISFC